MTHSELDRSFLLVETRGLLPASIRRKLSALSSLFDYLCEHNAVSGNSRRRREAANGERQ